MQDILRMNVDRNVAPSEYPSDSIRIMDVFETIQGEMPFAGRPCLFIRLAGCNLGNKDACPWCDTYFDFAAGRPYGFEELYNLMLDYRMKRQEEGHEQVLFVITGGEPSLQFKAFTEFFQYVTDEDERRNESTTHIGHPLIEPEQVTIQFESNGQFMAKMFPENRSYQPIFDCVHVVWSPKFPAPPKVVKGAKWWEWVAVTFRFVIGAGTQYADVAPAFRDIINECAVHGIFLSPINVYVPGSRPTFESMLLQPGVLDVEETIKNHRLAVSLLPTIPDACLSMQSHIYLGVK